MKCLEVNEFSACEIGPSHWLWNFSWLIEENGGERKGGAYWKLRERPLMTAIQMWKINKPTKKQNLFINCTFSILQLSTTCLTLDLGLPGWDSPPVLHLPRQLGREKPYRRWWPAPQGLVDQRTDGPQLPKVWANSLKWKEMAPIGDGERVRNRV